MFNTLVVFEKNSENFQILWNVTWLIYKLWKRQGNYEKSVIQFAFSSINYLESDLNLSLMMITGVYDNLKEDKNPVVSRDKEVSF